MLEILKDGHPTLTKVAKEVELIDGQIPVDVLMLIFMMNETMNRSNGIGLAAPQIDRSIRVIVYNNQYFDNGHLIGDSGEIINPVIHLCEDTKLIRSYEGCLSVNDTTGYVSRYDKIRVTGYDRNSNKVDFVAAGQTAIIIQHEVDHLNGILFNTKIIGV